MSKRIPNNTIEWKNKGSSYRLVTENLYEHSPKTEFGKIEIKEILKITLQKKCGLLSFIMTGSVWDTIRVEKRSYDEIKNMGVDILKYSSIRDEARSVYGMP